MADSDEYDDVPDSRPPPSAFALFQRATSLQFRDLRPREIAEKSARDWAALGDEERRKFQELAAEKAAEHERFLRLPTKLREAVAALDRAVDAETEADRMEDVIKKRAKRDVRRAKRAIRHANYAVQAAEQAFEAALEAAKTERGQRAEG